MPRKRSMSLAEYVQANIGPVDANGCRIWQGQRFANGYGRIQRKPRPCPSEVAHRVIYVMARGSVPDEIKIRHRCDNGAGGCVELSHLLPGTQADNMADMRVRGRASKGESHVHAKLTESDIVWARSMAGIMTQEEIGKRLGVNSSNINKIIRGDSWKSAPGHVSLSNPDPKWLRPEDILKIKEMAKTMKLADIAISFGVNPSTISRTVNGRK